MKKIAFVFDGLGFGGIERIGIDYIKIALELGYFVDVYNLNPSDSDFQKNIPESVKVYSKRYSRLQCPELYSYGCQKWWWGKYAYALISPVLTILQIIQRLFSKKLEYDVAIAIAGHVNDLSYVVKNFLKVKKKICWCHGNILSYFAICDAYPMLYKSIDKFVVLSNAGQKDIYPGHKFMYDKEILRIYNPTYLKINDCDTEIVKQLKKQYGDFILMVGRFEPRKRQDFAIKVVKKLKEMGLEKKLVLLGNGDTIESCKEFVKKENLENFVFFEGYKKNVHDYIAASYINILTSKWEGLPTVIIEAMTFGKPCVMTNSDDGEVSGNGKYCFLMDNDDEKDFAIAVYNLYKDKKLYKKYSELSIERAQAFTPNTVKKEFKKLIEE